MHANAANTKEKGISSPMALRAVATERAVSSTNTALRRGEVRFGCNIEARAVVIPKGKPEFSAFAQIPIGSRCLLS